MNKNTLNFLITIKNSSAINKEQLVLKYNNFNLKILHCLYKEGLIQSYFIIEKTIIVIQRSYFNKIPIFENLKILSKPSLIVYIKYSNLLSLHKKKITFFLSSNKNNVVTDLECKTLISGGKLLFVC